MQTFELQEIGSGTTAMLGGIVLFCLVITAIVWQTRPPGTAAAAAVYLGMAVSTGIAGLMLWFWIGHIRGGVQLDEERLVLDVPVYGRSIPVQRLITDKAEHITLQDDASRRLTFRTNGLGLPGYNLGWFRTRAGDRALVVITSPDVVVLPTRDDYVVMLSVVDADRFIQALRGSQQ